MDIKTIDIHMKTALNWESPSDPAKKCENNQQTSKRRTNFSKIKGESLALVVTSLSTVMLASESEVKRRAKIGKWQSRSLFKK